MNASVRPAIVVSLLLCLTGAVPVRRSVAQQATAPTSEEAIQAALKKVDAASQARDYALADRLLTPLIQQSPKRFALYLFRGNARYHMGLYEQAVADFAMFSQLRPNLPQGYQNQAYALHQLGRNVEALRDLDHADALRGTHSDLKLLQELLAATRSPDRIVVTIP